MSLLRKSSFWGLRKRICEPSGDQSGPSPALMLYGVTRRRPVPSAFTTKTACLPAGLAVTLWRTKTILPPSGGPRGPTAPAGPGGGRGAPLQAPPPSPPREEAAGGGLSFLIPAEGAVYAGP